MGFWNPRRLRLSPHEHQGSWHEGEWDYLIRQDRFWPESAKAPVVTP